jgi:hypothetical protein
MARHAIPDLLAGTLDLLILRTLQTDSLHGWVISERIQRPAIHRLEHRT